LTPEGTAKRRELVSAIGAASGLNRLDDTGRRALAEALAQVLQTSTENAKDPSRTHPVH
jgi:hypothetical protein